MTAADNIETKFGIPEKSLENIISILKQNNKINEIILFGSRAKGNFRKGSDIDLAVKAENLSFNELTSLKVEIDELMLPNYIDVINYNKIKNKELIDHIDRAGVVLA